ncbi:MAG: peptidase [Planctomycetes bacterium]|nr:peptidase [Planctomycetota bacterium]
MFRRILASLLILVCATSVFAASPRLSGISPRGVQRGTETVLTFSGSTLGDGEQILFYSPGFEVVKVETIDANNCKATVKISPDCRLGEHVAQVRTKTGISDYRTFYIGALPQVDEKEPNNFFDQPQPIALNQTIVGTIGGEDVDYYIVEAKKGQRICAEVEALRLGSAFFDPYVAILDMKRFELSAADDTPLVGQDAVASIVAPEDGKYVVQIRETAYGGGSNYRLHVGTFPRPLAVYPAGGKLGEEVEPKFLGDPAGEFTQKFKLPTATSNEFTGLFATAGTEISPSPNPFRLFEHGNSLEVEPNNAVAQATVATLPNALNGILQEPGDIDFFKFTATKGQVFEVECYGRRIRSAVDPVMVLYNAQGGAIVSNDDSRGPDSYFRVTIPADGEYLLSVTDHLQRGGPGFVYRVEFTGVVPSLQLSIPQVERYGQYRRQVYVAKGNRFGTVINASRANFGGKLLLEPQGMPAGITMVTEPMAENLASMPVVFEAAADAPLDGKLVDFIGRHAENPAIRGGFFNRAEFIIAAPGQSMYSWRDVDRLAVAVVDELPFKIDLVEPKVPLAQNGSMQLKVVATRKEGFKAPITLLLPFAPPGVGAAPSVTIPEGQNEALFPINAASNAQVGKWRVFVLGYAEIGGAAYSSTQLGNLEVTAPWVSFAMQRAAVEQGQPTEVVCKVEVATPFEGNANVQLVALPNKVVSAPMQFTKDTKELVFKVTTEKESPAGKHGIFGVVTITANGEPVIHNVGGAELRIDVPLPPKPNTPAPMPAAAVAAAAPAPMPVAAAPAKRLSRLEQLREDAKAKAAQGK